MRVGVAAQHYSLIMEDTPMGPQPSKIYDEVVPFYFIWNIPEAILEGSGWRTTAYTFDELCMNINKYFKGLNYEVLEVRQFI